MEVLSIIGILLGLLILIVFALRGVPLYVLAPLAALVVAIFAGGNILTTMTDTYMTGFANFMKNFFLMFALSSIFAKIMGDSGAAKRSPWWWPGWSAKPRRSTNGSWRCSPWAS